MDLNIIKQGDFVIFREHKKPNIFDKLITDEQVKEGFSKEDSRYVHVVVSGGGNEAVSANFPRVRAIKIMKKYKGRYIKVVRYKHKEYSQQKGSKIAYFSATMSNSYYGLLSLIWFKLNDFILKDNNIFASKNMPFCSLASAWALKKVFKESFESSGTIMPVHFTDKDKFEIIWEGILQD